MPKKRFSPEQIVTLLRRIEVAMSQGKSAQLASRDAGISEQSFYRWRKGYGRLDLDQARRMKDLEKENVRLKRLVASLSLDKRIFIFAKGPVHLGCLGCCGNVIPRADEVSGRRHDVRTPVDHSAG